MKLKIRNIGGGNLPKYQTPGSAGMDLMASVDAVIPPGTWKIVPTGIAIELPVGYEAQIRSRSGLAAKFGIAVLNSPGTIDSDFRGIVQVILFNHGQNDYIVSVGDRIAQMVIAKYEQAEVELAEELTDTERGAGGLGSTGK